MRVSGSMSICRGVSLFCVETHLVFLGHILCRGERVPAAARAVYRRLVGGWCDSWAGYAGLWGSPLSKCWFQWSQKEASRLNCPAPTFKDNSS